MARALSVLAAEARRLFNLYRRAARREGGIPPALVRLAAAAPGRRTQIPLRPKAQRSRGAAVVLACCETWISLVRSLTGSHFRHWPAVYR
jgi:hypothetical protein